MFRNEKSYVNVEEILRAEDENPVPTPMEFGWKKGQRTYYYSKKANHFSYGKSRQLNVFTSVVTAPNITLAVTAASHRRSLQFGDFGLHY